MTNTTPRKQMTGILQGCTTLARRCNHHCCHQRLPLVGQKADPSNSLLLYPGEYELQDKQMVQHIRITQEDYHGGELGYCDPSLIDQSKCHPERNYKSLDCRSYPFAPAIIKGKLVLVKDDRCPLNRTNEPQLDKFYWTVKREWQRIIDSVPNAKSWIAQLSLPDYILYQPENNEQHTKKPN